MNNGVFLFNHPKKGMVGQIDVDVNEAERVAREDAVKLYPDVQFQDAWTLTAWWLMEEDGLPFFEPKPWPYSIVYLREKMEEVMGEVPNWLILFVTPDNRSFTHEKAVSKEEARALIMSIIEPHGGRAEETDGGYTFKWTSPDGEEFVVGYAVNLKN